VNELINRWPDVAPYRELQARTEQALGNAQKAEEYFASARASQSRQPEIDQLITKLDSNPSDLDTRRQLGQLMMYYLSPEAGNGQIQSVLAMDAGDVLAHQLMADYYRRERMTTQSLRHQQIAEQLLAASSASMVPPGPPGTPTAPAIGDGQFSVPVVSPNAAPIAPTSDTKDKNGVASGGQ
jgi:hypothetical protein